MILFKEHASSLLTYSAGSVSKERSGGGGFGLLWGQTLLSIITIGFYLPWAYGKIGRWIASVTYYDYCSEDCKTRAGELG
jgi:hypothetical protein